MNAECCGEKRFEVIDVTTADILAEKARTRQPQHSVQAQAVWHRLEKLNRRKTEAIQRAQLWTELRAKQHNYDASSQGDTQVSDTTVTLSQSRTPREAATVIAQHARLIGHHAICCDLMNFRRNSLPIRHITNNNAILQLLCNSDQRIRIKQNIHEIFIRD